MITSSGVYSINKFLGGAGGDWAGTIAVGLLGTTATSSATTALQYEIARYSADKNFIYSASGSRIIIGGYMDTDLIAKIYEIAVFPTTEDNFSNLDHTPITDFSEVDTSGSSTWSYQTGTTASVSTASFRAGTQDVRLQAGSTVWNSNIYASSDGYFDTDYLNMLYLVSSSISAASVTTVFVDDLGTTWTASGTLSATASNTWGVLQMNFNTKDSAFSDTIATASITLTAANGQLFLDHLKFVKNYSKDESQLVLARQASSAYASPFITKTYGQSARIEYTLQVT
jgi:hypothetical protein